MGDDLFFKPYIGEDYAKNQENPQRYGYHFIGESHYGDKHEYTPDKTMRIIEQCGFDSGHGACSRFFAKLLQVATSEPIPALDRKFQWNQLAYSNYIQDLLPKSRQAPTAEMWARGERAFFDCLALTRPQVLVVLGWRLWERLPKHLGEMVTDFEDWQSGFLVPWSENQKKTRDDLKSEHPGLIVREICLFKHGHTVTAAVPIAHPSGRGFNWRVAAERAATPALIYSTFFD